MMVCSRDHGSLKDENSEAVICFPQRLSSDTNSIVFLSPGPLPLLDFLNKLES